MFKSWGDQITTGETNEILKGLFSKHRDAIKASSIRERLRGISDIPDLCGVDLPISEANTLVNLDLDCKVRVAEDLYHFAQTLAFASKRQDLDLGIDKKGVAYEKFRESERSCRKTNELFRAWKRGSIQFDPRAEAVLHSAQRKISDVLGDCPTVDRYHYRFGPGATTQVPKRTACPKVKLGQTLACSGDMEPILSDVLSTLPHLLNEGDVVTATVEIHPGKLVFVPKSYKTDRSVMIEPWLNGFVQLGVGDYIADRLKRNGIDIRDQEKNKSLARGASITGALATLDLSSASDTISKCLVEHLLPYDWYNLLSCLRTSVCDTGGEVITLEKFSSMGNGFTFPLETLIFWALVDSVPGCRGRTSVYGDDIIMPSQAYDEVVRVLRVFGFTANAEKSFGTGYFRESCGGDYFFGVDIRPCFIKDRMFGQDAFRLHNFYKRKGLDDFAEYILQYIPEHVRLYGPDGFGDGHLIGNDWGYTSNKITRRQWGGRLFDTYSWKGRKLYRPLPGDRILPHYSIYLRDANLEDEGNVDWPSVPLPFRLLKESLRGWLTHEFEPGLGYEFCVKNGERVPVDTLPGTRGWKRMAVYTLVR